MQSQKRSVINQDIEHAIGNFRKAAAKYGRFERYYRGDHDLTFATEKFQNAFGSLFREFAMNLCPAIVDATRDKLRIARFGVQARTDHEIHETHEKLHQTIERIWAGNRMGQRAGEIHKEALRCGDAYAIVWTDPRGAVTIYPQRAASIMAVYDEDSPGLMRWAAKHWRTADKRTRLNIFYPDRIEKYVSKGEREGEGLPEADEFVALAADLITENTEKNLTTKSHETIRRSTNGSVVVNPFGRVPVFHFANNADIGCLGASELTAAIPIQDGLNKSILDMLVAMEFSAFRQRWITGLEVEKDVETGKEMAPFAAGVERLWVATSTETKFGDFNTSNLDQFLKVKDGFRIDMASVTGTPLHYFLQNTRGFASGEALKKNETRFLAKVRDRQEAFGQVWADVMAFALEMAGGPRAELATHWGDPAPMDEKEMLANILLRKQIGITTEQAMKEAGYGDEDVRRMTR